MRSVWFNRKIIRSWYEFSEKSFKSFEWRRPREKGFILTLCDFYRLLKEKLLIQTKIIFNIPRWRWILDSLGERYWKRKFEMEYGYDDGKAYMMDIISIFKLFKLITSVFLWAVGSIESFSAYLKIKRRTLLVLQKKSLYFKKTNHDFIYQNMNKHVWISKT